MIFWLAGQYLLTYSGICMWPYPISSLAPNMFIVLERPGMGITNQRM